MEKRTVYFCANRLSVEEKVLAEKIAKVLEEEVETISDGKRPINVVIHNVQVHGEKEFDSPCFFFGRKLDLLKCNSKVWNLPAIKEMIPTEKTYNRSVDCKREVYNTIIEAAAFLAIEEEEIPVNKFVETPNGITVGSLGAMINITEEEAIYLKRIKDILGGGKMVIQKGDLRIEVE